MPAESDVRETLKTFADNDYAPPEDIAPAAFALEILPFLGSSDGELRERYVYGTLHRWIVRRILDTVAIVELGRILVDADHLFHGIGDVGKDTAFMRAFSVLLLAPIVSTHRRDPLLAPSDLDLILAKTVEYLDREQDLRGYVSKEEWWAHGVAHAADVLGQLAPCEEVTAADLASMLDAIARKALTDSAVFVFEEDARLASAAIEILKRPDLDREWIAGWFPRLVPEARWTGELPRVHHRFVNARNVLRCLYFQSRKAGLSRAITDGIEAAMKSLPER